MGVVATVLLRTLLLLLGLLTLLVLLLLFLPFDIRLQAEADLAADSWEEELTGRADGRLRLRWGLLVLSGGVGWAGGGIQWADLRLSGLRLGGRSRTGGSRQTDGGSRTDDGGQPGEGRRPSRGAARTRRERKRRWGRARPHPDVLMAAVREAARLPRRLWRTLGIRAAVEATYGFPDPALTGLCEALRWGAGLGGSLRLTPEFQHPCLVGRAEVTGRVYGFRLLGIAWRLLRTPEIWNYLVGRIRYRPLRRILLQGG